VVQNLVNAGFKNFRLPVTFEQVAIQAAPYTIPTNHTMWRLIDSTILWAQEMDFTLSICNHHGIEMTNANYTNEIARKTIIWQQVISKYGSLDPERYFFELSNEPTNTISNDNLYVITNSMINAIRSAGSQHTLIVGGNGWNSAGGLVTSKKYNDPDIIYTFHDYDPYEFTHQQLSFTTPTLPFRVFPLAGSGDSLNIVNNILMVKTWADTSGVPVMMGEFGCSTSADTTSRCNWINTITNVLKSTSMGWYYWDVITTNEAFGFYNTTNNSMISCFASALRLGTSNVCAKMVMTDDSEGVGSLIEQLACAKEGETIRFEQGLANDTIWLYAFPATISKNIVLKNDLANPIYISTSFEQPALIIPFGAKAQLHGVHIVGKEEKIIENNGVLHLRNCNIKTASNSKFNQSSGKIIIEGQTAIKM
jgi:endoglucanase